MSHASRLRQLKRRIASGELRLPTYDELAVKLQAMASERETWAGVPMMVDGFSLTLEPRYPYQFHICKSSDVDDAAIKKALEAPEIINSWFYDRLRAMVYIVREKGKLTARIELGHNRITMLINTLGASRGWLLSAEAKAHEKLQELVTEQQMRCYALTGTFLETSKRSKVTYIFRKLRPTIAMSVVDGCMKGLCALCMHPIGLYSGTHAGAMTPTDDLIAHLVTMRGDEHYFWRICSQHELHRHEAALY